MCINNSDSVEKLKSRLRDRLTVYDEQHDCREWSDYSFDSRRAIVSAVESAIMYAWPHSAYLVLKAMSYTMEDCEPGQWFNEAAVLLHALNVSGEVEPGTYERWSSQYGDASAARWREQSRDVAEFWTEEVETWPTDDWLLIRDWLIVASQWAFVKEWFSFEVQAAISFWSQRA
jgi:hypothetical protein